MLFVFSLNFAADTKIINGYNFVAPLNTVFPPISAFLFKRFLFNFETLRYSTYLRAALRRGRHLFQSSINNLYEVSKLCYFLFPNNK